VDKTLMKEVKLHVDRNIQHYLQSQSCFYYIYGLLATHQASGFQVLLTLISI
jgi:hypothetical protein